MTGEKDKGSKLDKGKEKAVDIPTKAEGKKDGTPTKDLAKGSQNDKKDKLQEEDLSEEDQQLKSELEMLVERLKEPNTELYKPALEAIKSFIKTSTSSMTAVPKPLKFLRPHYPELTSLYEEWNEGPDKFQFADVLSVLGMTYADEDRTDSLKFRLLAPSEDLGSWGHEYVRHLALEIGTEYGRRLEKDEDTTDLKDLALTLVPYFVKHNAEADAVDLLSELEIIEQIPPFLDENTYQRVCLYMVSMVNLLAPPEDVAFLRTAHAIYRQYNKLPQAMTLAIRLHDIALIQEDFDATEDRSLKKQLAFLAARQQIRLECEDSELTECLSNSQLSEHFLALGKELNILEPKVPEDIYKSHLENARTGPGSGNMDSARSNLGSTFVNAFVNAGFSQDKLMLVEDENSSWVYKNKDLGMLSATASIGMLMQWNVENGLQSIDKYMYSDDPYIKAGTALAIGILNCGVRSDSDPAMALLCGQAYLESGDPTIRTSAIMGLGLSYAGSQRLDLMEMLLPLVCDTSLSMQISSMAAMALGLMFVGSSNGEINTTILQVFMERVEANEEVHLKDKWGRFLALGLALLFIGRQEEADATLETLKAIDHPIAKSTAVLVDACAYAGTGNVLKYQSMLHICSEHIEAGEGKEGEDLRQTYAVIALALISMGEDIGSEMSLRQFGHLMHYGDSAIRKAVPLAMGLISASNPQMKVYDTLSRYSHDNYLDVAMNAIFAMGLVGAGTNNARLAQLLRQLASYYHRDMNFVFMVRIAQGLLHMGKGTLSVNPFHTDRQVLSKVATAGLLTVLIALIDPKSFILGDAHYLLYFLAPAMHPRFLITLDEDLKPLSVSVRVGQAVDVVGQAGRPKTITGWQTQSTPVLLSHGERAELEDEEYISLTHSLEGIVILKKNPSWEGEGRR